MECFGHVDETRGTLWILELQVRPTDADDGGERGRPVEGDVKVAAQDSPYNGIDEGDDLFGAGRIGDAGENFGDGGEFLSGCEFASGLIGLATDPRTEGIETPQRAGNAVRTCLCPQFGDDGEALLVGQVQDAINHALVVDIAWTTHEQVGNTVSRGGAFSGITATGLGFEKFLTGK